MRGEQAERRDLSHRSASRSRYRERRDERGRNCPSPGAEHRKEHVVDHYNPRNKSDTRRTAKYVTAERCEGRSSSQHKNRRPSPRLSRDDRASPVSQRSRSQGRNSKWSKSASRSGSWARRRHSPATARRSPIVERSSRRSGSGGRVAEAASANRQLHVSERGLSRRSPIDSSRRGGESSTRHSPNHDKGTRRLSPGESKMRVDGALRRSSQSEGRSRLASWSHSRERVPAEAAKHPNHAEVPSRSRSRCRSADCPTPDLVSSRPCNADSRGTSSARNSLGRQEKRASDQETSPKRAEDSVVRDKCGDEGPAEAPPRRSELCPGTRQCPSVSRSPLVRSRVPEGERDEGKEGESSCPVTTSGTEQPALEKSRILSDPNPVSRSPGECVQKRNAQEEEPAQEKDELSAKVEQHPPPPYVAESNHSPPIQRREDRLHSERIRDDDRRCDGRSAGTSGASITAAAATDCSRKVDEPGGPVPRFPSEEIRRSVEADRRTVKRRIVATEPLASLETPEMYRACRGPSPRGFPRPQRSPRGRGEHLFPAMNRFQPVSPSTWHRLDRDERFDFPHPLHPVDTGRSVRLVARRGDRNLLISAQPRLRNATPNEAQRVQLQNGMFHHPAQIHQRHLRKTPIHIQAAAGRNRKMVGIAGRGLQERRNATAASNADGKWSHDLFEQLSSEPERKRRRFNLYGETLERVDD